jgi:hypothetical protein
LYFHFPLHATSAFYYLLFFSETVCKGNTGVICSLFHRLIGCLSDYFTIICHSVLGVFIAVRERESRVLRLVPVLPSHRLLQELLSALEASGVFVLSLNPVTVNNAAKALKVGPPAPNRTLPFLLQSS